MGFFRQAGSREKSRWMLAFGVGFTVGIAAVCLFTKKTVAETGFLDAAFFSEIQFLEINQNNLFLYSLQQRLGTAAFLVLLSAAGLTGVGTWLFLGWCGLSVGSILTALSLRYGMRGILFFLGCILPQQILLIPGYLMLLAWCKRKAGWRKFLSAFGMILGGCILESYGNPIVIKMVIKIF